MSDSGNVPQVQGTGLRQFSGILSVVDLSGNNLLTATSSAVVLGNTTDNPVVEVISPFVQFASGTGPTILSLTYQGAPTNQKNSLVRLGSTAPGSFAISSASDADPATPQHNLMVGTRTGTSWSTLQFGETGSIVTMLGGGATTGTPVDMTPDSGSFTANYTGFAGSVTGAATWYRIGRVFILSLQPTTGISAANSFTISNIPAAATPQSVTTQFVACPAVCLLDNNVSLAQTNTPAAAFFSGSTLNFVYGTSSIGWTAAGTKGINLPFTIAYIG